MKYFSHLKEGKRLDLPKRTVTIIVGKDDFKSERMTFGVTEVPPNTTMLPHIHQNEEEIIYIMEGCGYAQVGDETQKIEPGTVILAKIGQEHFISNESDKPMRFSFCFAPSMTVFPQQQLSKD